MKSQWSQVVFPGQKVNLRIEADVLPAIVQECNYVSKVSADCL